jgi:probable rRNA maturation factor
MGQRTVEIVDATGRVKEADRRWLQEQVARALELQSLTGAVSARIVPDAEMAAAHAEFCGVEGTTDVITFDLTDPEDDAPSKGVVEADLLLCLDEAERQAKSRGHEPRRELLLYIIHGVLHCLGHDDHDEASYTRMHAEEDRLMAALGVGATFSTDPRQGGDR